MKITITIIVSSILLILSLLHVYWVLGGKKGLEAAVPAAMGAKVISTEAPKFGFIIATMIVAIGLCAASIMVYNNTFSFLFSVDAKWIKLGTRILGIVFLLRAVGDFNYCGLFKKKRDTLFNKWDSKLFVPLCIIIGGLSVILSYL